MPAPPRPQRDRELEYDRLRDGYGLDANKLVLQRKQSSLSLRRKHFPDCPFFRLSAGMADRHVTSFHATIFRALS